MTSSTYFPKEETGLHLGNKRQHNKFIKFLKQHEFGVWGTALDDYTKFSSTLINLLWYIDLHHNKLKSRGGCTFPEVIVKNLINFNKPSAHGHNAKPVNSSDTRIKVNNLLEYLDRSYFSKPHMNLLKEHVYADSLEHLDNQVTRATEAQYGTKKELSIEEFLIRKIKSVPRVDLFWSEHFLKNWLINRVHMNPF